VETFCAPKIFWEIARVEKQINKQISFELDEELEF